MITLSYQALIVCMVSMYSGDQGRQHHRKKWMKFHRIWTVTGRLVLSDYVMIRALIVWLRSCVSVSGNEKRSEMTLGLFAWFRAVAFKSFRWQSRAYMVAVRKTTKFLLCRSCPLSTLTRRLEPNEYSRCVIPTFESLCGNLDIS